MKKKETIEKDRGLVKIRSRYLDLVEGYLGKAKEGLNYDDSLIPCFPLMVSSIEAFSYEMELCLSKIIKEDNLKYLNNIEIQNLITKINHSLKIISLGRFEPIQKLKVFDFLLSSNGKEKFNSFYPILADLKIIRNMIIHPSLVYYKISVELPSKEEALKNMENGIIDLGTFISEYPGKDKINGLIQRKLLNNKNLGLDIYTYFSKKDIAEYFYNECKQFFETFYSEIENIEIKKNVNLFFQM